jgi:hypothetical protein
MIFLASLIFAALLFVVPGELALVMFSHAVPFVSPLQALIALNVLVYALVLVGVRLGRKVLIDFDYQEKTVGGLRPKEWLDVSSCRWLNILGLVSVTAGALLLLSKGKLPVPFWFLFGAVVLGLWDVVKRRQLLSFPGELPAARFSLEAVTPLTDGSGRKVEFDWTLWETSASGTGSLNAAFTISEADYTAAKGLSRYPVVPVENYARYPREQFHGSVQQVAAFFREHSENHGFSPLMEMANIVCFARSIRYASDEQTRNQPEWANFAVETLYDAAGDCEDHAILAAALLHYLGHSVALFYLELEDSGHIAIGFECPDGGGAFFATGADGRTYYYVETVPTSSAERVGDISAEFLTSLKNWKVLPVSHGA